ncbi:MAG: outer membrane lipoprotein carrier protein LolA [Gemmatimonadetes bacterium]|nr:outer membrane lipoprotein carrier protein LolA [Gemmatimonadota bacterium]
MMQRDRRELVEARRGWRVLARRAERRVEGWRAGCRVMVGALTLAAATADATAGAQAPRDTAAAMQLYRAAAAKFAGARTMRAGFEQTLLSPLSATPRTSRGELMQRPPSRFAFRFTEPKGDAIISDGEALWVYLPSTAKGQVLKLPREVGGAFDVVARLLANPGDRSQVRVLPETERVGGKAVTVFALTPRAEGAPFESAKVWIGADKLVRQIEVVEPGGLRRRMRFINMRLGVALPRRAFVFEVPAGVRIVDQAALMGGAPSRRP